MLLFGEVNADPLTYKVVGDTVTIKDCKETASGALAIPLTYDGKPVTSIGNIAFKNCSSLTSVIIGNNVTSIGRWAFEGCHSLTNVTISSSVIRIGSVAFRDCSSLKVLLLKGMHLLLLVPMFSNTYPLG
ncbi:leucine-rich repeat domain-containing protein [bacterium]|nr:leucine-rich repeat domain-containing protein [bacterium]